MASTKYRNLHSGDQINKRTHWDRVHGVSDPDETGFVTVNTDDDHNARYPADATVETV